MKTIDAKQAEGTIIQQFMSLVFAFAFTAWLVGCAPYRPIIIKASPLSDQTLQYDQGRQVFISHSLNSSVGLVLSTEAIQPRNPVDFNVCVANRSNNPFNLSTENIHVRCERKNIYVYRPEETLRDQEKRSELSAASLAGLYPEDILALTPQLTKYFEVRNQKLRDFAQSLLQAQTIMPNSNHNGMVRIAFPSCTDKLEVTIKTGEDIHRFEFNIIIK